MIGMPVFAVIIYTNLKNKIEILFLSFNFDSSK